MNLRSLQENVTETIQAFDNVAEFIEEKTGDDTVKETVRPINYGDILRRIEFVGGNVTVAQLTVYKEPSRNRARPSAPVGGTVNLITGELVPPDGWAFIPSDSGEVWASTALWNDGVNQTGWSEPYLASGTSGEAGPQGPQGDKGDKGDIGPQGPEGSQGPQGEKGEKGADGKDGIDGSTYEYVYFRGLTSADKPENIPSGEGNDKDDYTPSYTKTVTVDGNTIVLKWSDRAQGVDEIYKYEWRSERSKKDTSTWNDFTAPILWAKYGEKGKDGDGIQYIFKNTAVYSRPDNPTPDGYTTDPKYQGLESEEYVPTGWSDDMQDVSASSPYCWVSIRKYKNNKWGPYSNATLWAKYGKDGQDSAGGDGTSGTRFEFIYKRVADESIDVVAPDSVNEDGYEPAEWSLYPKGVTDDLQVEYICQREKEDGIWGEYSDPAIWAMYGKIGRDGNGIEYIYKLTKDETIDPGQPVAPSNIDPESYPSDWSDDPISVNETDTVCWVSTRKQYYNENGDQRWGDYSKPTVWAKYGKDGKEGGGRTIFMFTASDDKTNTPVKPESSEISWDPDTNTITIKEGSIWKSNSDEVSGKYVWLTTGSFNSSGTLLNPGWSEPIKITGDDGVAGTDGLTTEFIYRLISNEDNFQQLVEYLSKPENYLEVTDTGVVPETNDNICKSSWTPSPTGIDGETWSMEVTCVRTKQPDGSWGPWNGPIRWAVWGEDGIDGDGVEYIFKVTPSDVTNTNISDTHLLYIPPKLWYDHNEYGEIYQTNEFYPGNSDKWPAELDLDWTDEPRDVGPDEPLEWVSIRRKIDGVWGDFTSPKLWAKYAEDGYAYKTSYVFTRSNEKPAIPVDGTDTDFDNPIPVDPDNIVVWNDTIPDGSSKVWMSYKTFSGNPKSPIDEDWSAPILMQDRNDFQVEYSIKESPVSPIGLQNYFDLLVAAGNLEPTSEEVEAEFRKENPDWSDEFETGAIWMATSSYRDGVWTGWNVTRIKGEKGDTGPAGTGIAIRGTFTYDQLVAADAYFANPTGTKPSPYFTDDKLETGDCYMISSGTNSKNEDVTGHMFVYDGSGNNFDERWIDAGLVKGEPGQSKYLYMAFADVWKGAVKTLPGGSIDPNGGKYVGYKVSDGALDGDVLLEWDTYTWSKWNGDDGFGVEQIFLLTSKNSKYNEDVAPDVPLETNITKDYLPEHGLGADAFGSKWSDSPQNVSDGYPYQWVVSRKWDGVNEYPWKGSVDENGEATGKASLYSRYAYDGQGAYRLALSQDYFLIPCEEDGTVDTDFKEAVQTSMSLFIGDDPVLEKVTYTAEGYDVVEGVLNLTTEQIKSLPAVTQIVCEAKYNNVTTTATFTVEKTQNAYNIEPRVLTIKKDPESLYPIIDSFNVNVYRWNGTGWSNYTGNMSVDFNHVNGSKDTETVIVDNGEAIVPINDEYDLTWIKLYLSEHSKYYEKVDIIMDGKDGKDGADGEDGKDGQDGKSSKTPVIYSAGNFDTSIATNGGYIGNSNQAPYVFYDEVEELRGFYIAYGTPLAAPSEDNIIDKDEEVDWINILDNAASWILMDKFNAIYSDIGVFNHALVGKWIFHGDYMFSQDGELGYETVGGTSYELVIPSGSPVLYSGDKCSYDRALSSTIAYSNSGPDLNRIRGLKLYERIEEGIWIPNICLNQVTGEAWFAGKKVHFNADGSGILGDGMEWTSDGTVTFKKPFIYTPEEKTLIVDDGGDYDAYYELDLSSENFVWNNKNIIIKPHNVYYSDFNQFVYLRGDLDNLSGSFKLTNDTEHLLRIQGIELSAPYTEIIDGSATHYNGLNTLYIYPNTSCTFTIQSNKIFVDNPLWYTGNGGACNALSKVAPGFSNCYQVDVGTYWVDYKGCNFTHFIITDTYHYNLQYEIYSDEGEFLSSGTVQDNKWVSVGNYKNFQFKLIYTDMYVVPENAITARILFVENNLFSGEIIVCNSFKASSKMSCKTVGNVSKKINTCISVPANIAKVELKSIIPITSTFTDSENNIEFAGEDYYEDYKLFRAIKVWSTDDTGCTENISVRYRRDNNSIYVNDPNNDVDNTFIHRFADSMIYRPKSLSLTVDPTNDGKGDKSREARLVFYAYDIADKVVEAIDVIVAKFRGQLSISQMEHWPNNDEI